jgi:hypothetical protein
MGKLSNLNTAHLKTGNYFPDPIATAKPMARGYTDTAKETKMVSTPGSDASGNEGLPGGPNKP